MIAVYTLTSGLHDEAAVGKISREFLGGIFKEGEFKFRGDDFSDFGTYTLDLIYVRTGGTEGIFKKLLPELLSKGCRRFYLLTSGKSNSLAASMEILSYLRQQGLQGEIIHGGSHYITSRISILEKVGRALKNFDGMRLGVIGRPSDWLISSSADYSYVRQRLGIELVDVPMEELIEEISRTKEDPAEEYIIKSKSSSPIASDIDLSLPVAVKIRTALHAILAQYSLSGFTIRCFDLLTSVHNTGCLALATLNEEGIPSGCEGDVPALLSMSIANAVTGVSGFQANPAEINPETGEVLFAHCTIPLNMVTRFDLDTHFESGIGVGIRGHMNEGEVTVFKVSGDLKRVFISEGYLIRNQTKPDLCRTQIVVQLPPEDARYFLTDPIGNHHIIIPGHCKAILEEII